MAVSDAEHDIAMNRIGFYYVGGPASHAPGLPPEAVAIVRRYPRHPIGLQGHWQDRHYANREEYARRYNSWMWDYVSNNHP